MSSPCYWSSKSSQVTQNSALVSTFKSVKSQKPWFCSLLTPYAFCSYLAFDFVANNNKPPKWTEMQSEIHLGNLLLLVTSPVNNQKKHITKTKYEIYIQQNRRNRNCRHSDQWKTSPTWKLFDHRNSWTCQLISQCSETMYTVSLKLQYSNFKLFSSVHQILEAFLNITSQGDRVLQSCNTGRKVIAE